MALQVTKLKQVRLWRTWRSIYDTRFRGERTRTQNYGIVGELRSLEIIALTT